jgi:3'(2'), 5'-bisphosphate nucleotidase
VSQTWDFADPALLDGLTAIASEAAAAILAVRDPALTRRDKADHSPVTQADEAAEAVILEGLARLLPGVLVVSEEASSRHAAQAIDQPFLLVDPLDGTREFLAGETEFTVNIAIVLGGTPLAGVVMAPAQGRVWRGVVGHGAERLRLAAGAPAGAARERTPIRTRAWPAQGAVALVSRFHRDGATEAYLDRCAGIERQVCGSSLKFCRLAEGSADLYARLSPISEWDIAAGHAVLAAAGGAMTRPDGAPLRYGQAGSRVGGFIAVGDPAFALVRP